MKDKNLQTRLEIVIDQLIDDNHSAMAEQVKQAITEIEKLEQLEAAIDKLKPFIHENNMEGESDYEKAVLNLERKVKEINSSKE